MTTTRSNKLSLVHTEASLGWGGQEIRILTEAEGMIRRGFSVMLLCPEEACIYKEAKLYSVPVKALPIARKNLKGLCSIFHWLKNNPADVINTHSSTDSWLVAIASKALKAAPRLLRTRHISAPIPNNFPTRWLYQSATSHIVTTGENLRRQLVDMNGFDHKRITSIPTGIDTTRFVPGDKNKARIHLGLPEDGIIIGIVATLRSWKGHSYLIDAFAKLSDSGARLFIIGDGPMRETLKKRITQLNLDHRIIMAGNQRDVLPWLHAMDIFVLPSYANEGVPQAIMQAMACGLPIVTTSVGSITELVENKRTGIIIEPKQVEPLLDAISRLIDNPNLREQLGNNAIEVVRQRFDQELMLDKMQEVLFQICD